jgi:RING finger protein 113A
MLVSFIYLNLQRFTLPSLDLAGWQLDKLAENPKKRVEDVSDSDDSDDEDVPFACLICRKHYSDPVVTRCGHYYCSACAIKRYAKTPKCLACGAPTAGIFNRADKIIEKVNKKRKEKEERARAVGDPAGEGGAVEIEGLRTVERGQEEEDASESSD